MKKYIKTTIIVVVSLIAFLLVGVLGYGAYILISYNRIGDQTLEVTHNSTLETININEEYSCITYNLGFGAYSQDFTFFMDTGYDKNNQKTQGYYGKLTVALCQILREQKPMTNSLLYKRIVSFFNQHRGALPQTPVLSGDLETFRITDMFQ